MAVRFGPLLGGGFYDDKEGAGGGGGYTNEQAQDAVGSILTDTASIDFTYSDAGNQITADVLPAGVDHDSLANFVSNEHIDHTSVTLTAGTGLSGGGDISANRSFSIANTGVSAATYGSSSTSPAIAVNAQGQITSATDTNINHDALTNFVSNEHIDHTAVSITAGDGLTGGGDISSSRSLAVSYGSSPANIGTQANGSATTVSRSDHVHGTPMTTNGDILYYNSGVSRLAIGTEGKVLKSVSGALVYDYPVNNSLATYRSLFDDFMGVTNASTHTLGWSFSNSGTGAAGVAITAEAGTLGVHSCGTGTTTTGRSGMGLNSASLYCSNGQLTIEWKIRVPTLADGTNDFLVFCGAADNTTTSGYPTDGVYFTCSSTLSNWHANTTSGSVSSVSDTGVAVTTDWVILKIVANSAGTSVEFFIDGTSVATITTNIPNTTSSVFGPAIKIEKIAGASGRSVYFDYMSLLLAL